MGLTLLLTRPAEASAQSAARLAALGHAVIAAPMLEPRGRGPGRLVPEGVAPAAVAITSARALAAIEGHPDLPALRALPLFAVGGATAAAAREAGFSKVHAAAGDALALAQSIAAARPAGPVLHLAGEEVSRPLAPLLAPAGIECAVTVVYGAEPASGLSEPALRALNDRTIDAVLHYSRRSAQAYLACAARAGILGAALAPAQLCLSERVAEPLRQKGAGRVMVSERPDEASLFDLLSPARLAKAAPSR